ncbi:MAG: transporter [Syntrophobacteraceae bacterium]
MAGFTYGHYSASGILNGTDNVSKEQVWEKYLAAPQSLGIDFYTFSLVRGLTDNLSVVALIPYSVRSLTVETRARQVVTMNTDGLGDVQVGGIYRIHQGPKDLWTFYGGLSAPTGSINERGNLPGKIDVKLPYPVQLGTGTVDLYPTLTYMGKCESLLWGAQASGIIHLGTNWDGYRWGDSYELSSWVGYQFFKGLAGSLRLDWQSSGQISGADPELNPLQAPATDPNDFGGDRLLILPGLTWSITNGPLKGNSLVLEGGVPVYQWLTGPQLKMSYLLIAGWRWVF